MSWHNYAIFSKYFFLLGTHNVRVLFKHKNIIIKYTRARNQKIHIHTLLIIPLHREEVTEHLQAQDIRKKINVKKLGPSSQQDDCKTRKGTKYCITKQ